MSIQALLFKIQQSPSSLQATQILREEKRTPTSQLLQAMANSIDIRNASPDDFTQIADIWRHYVTNSIVNLEETPPTTHQVQRTLSGVFSKNYPFIVAVDGATICGYAYMGPFNERSGYRFCCEDSIYLRPEYAGKGLGKRLLEMLIQKTKAETEITQVLAKISISPEAALEEIASCRLHMAFGFKEAGRLKNVGWKFRGWLDVVILQLDLGSVAGEGA